MKPEILLIGGATDYMKKRYREHFVLHDADEIDNMEAWLNANGERITGVSTFGATGIDAATMAALPNLEVISGYGVGYDAIDVEAALDRNIPVTHTPDVLNADVANTAIMLMLAVSRRLVRDDTWVRSGNWKKNGNAPLTRSIEGSKVGILGLGRIGEEIARKLQAFNCVVSYHSRHRKADSNYKYFSDLVDMAKAVDYLIVITPGGAATYHLVNRAVMDALGPEGTLINIARGSVVDETELVSALQEGRLGNAGLDVFENEPNVPRELFEMENVVLLPHVGSATVETRRAMGDLTIDNLISYFEDGTVLTPIPECRELAERLKMQAR